MILVSKVVFNVVKEGFYLVIYGMSLYVIVFLFKSEMLLIFGKIGMVEIYYGIMVMIILFFVGYFLLDNL